MQFTENRDCIILLKIQIYFVIFAYKIGKSWYNIGEGNLRMQFTENRDCIWKTSFKEERTDD